MFTYSKNELIDQNLMLMNYNLLVYTVVNLV